MRERPESRLPLYPGRDRRKSRLAGICTKKKKNPIGNECRKHPTKTKVRGKTWKKGKVFISEDGRGEVRISSNTSCMF